jgi:hypothetical protein
MDAAEDARSRYLQLRDDVESQNICDVPLERSPDPPQQYTKQPKQEQEPDEAGHSPLKKWLVTLSKRLYEMIPDRLWDLYETTEFSPGCVLERVDIKVWIDVLGTAERSEKWVTGKSCENLSA